MTTSSDSHIKQSSSPLLNAFCARDSQKKLTCSIIEITTVSGGTATVVLSRSDASTPLRLRNALMDAGIPHLSPKDWKPIHESVVSAPMSENAQVVTRAGWHGRQFVRPDGRIFGRGTKLILHPDYQMPTDAITSGKLNRWKHGVATPARFSSSIAFSIGVGFAACLLGRVPNVKSGIFHLFGPSSQGKTTAIRVANSVSFNGNAYETWDKTQASHEESLSQYCCALTTIDEIERIVANPSDVVRIVRNMGFVIEGERGRGRSRVYASDGIASWRSLAISTGECSIASLAERAAFTRTEGDLVRLIDIPVVVANGNGMFDLLPPDESSAPLRDQMERTAGRHYGVAAEEFISRFINDDEGSLHHVRRWMEAFHSHVTTRRSDPWEDRFCSRFSFVYAATRLAAKFEILPWDKTFIQNVVLRHYQEARKAVSQSRPNVDELISQIGSKLAETDRFIWDRDIDSTTNLDELDGFMRAATDGDLVYHVKTASMSRWFKPGASLEDIGRRLLAQGVLLTDDRGLPTKQVSIKGVAGKLRYYCFSQRRLLAQD